MFSWKKKVWAELYLQSFLSSCLDFAFDSSKQSAGFFHFFLLSLSVDTILFITRVQFMRIWRPWLLYNPGRTHSFFSVTGPGSWSYEIKADVLQSTAWENRYLRFLILSALQQVNMNKGPNKSFAPDDSRRQRGRTSSDVIYIWHQPFFFLHNVAWGSELCLSLRTSMRALWCAKTRI